VRITVLFTTQLKAALGKSSEELELDRPARVGDVLERLRERHGDALQGLLYDAAGKLLPSVLLCVGDEQVSADHSVELREGDTITLLSAISGG
jgi:molybdopterin converting factor small subunit